MSLHELHKGSEWYAVAESERTSLQRLAARTQGLVTPGNVFTIVGMLLTVAGFLALYRHAFWQAFVLVIVGRFCDILDGHIARLTHTSGPVGEGLDAFMDKLVIGVGAVTLVAVHAVPLALLIPVIAIQVLVALVVMAARQLQVRIHPSRIGKYSTFALWIAILCYLARYLAYELHQAALFHDLRMIANGLMVVVFVGSLMAFVRYASAISSQLLQKKQKHRR
jgi:phosphatidylglycerophosphate synthase